MSCSRIWLTPLVDDCHLDSITKLEIKTLGDSLDKKTLKNKCGYSLVWDMLCEPDEWRMPNGVGIHCCRAFCKNLSFLFSHLLLFTRWWLVPSPSRVLQLPSFLTVQLGTALECLFWGARATLLSINSPYFHTQKNKKETHFWNFPEQEKKKSWRRYFATFKISILFCPTNEQSQASLLSRILSISLARVLRKDFYFFNFLFPLAWAWVESRREILKRFWDLCVCVCVFFSSARGVDSVFFLFMRAKIWSFVVVCLSITSAFFSFFSFLGVLSSF